MTGLYEPKSLGRLLGDGSRVNPSGVSWMRKIQPQIREGYKHLASVFCPFSDILPVFLIDQPKQEGNLEGLWESSSFKYGGEQENVGVRI